MEYIEYIYITSTISDYKEGNNIYSISNSKSRNEITLSKTICENIENKIGKIYLTMRKNYQQNGETSFNAPLKAVIECVTKIILSDDPHVSKTMSSRHASHVKNEGHRTEEKFAKLIGGDVLAGRGKTDVKYNGHTFSIKTHCKRIQFALYDKNSKNWNDEILSLKLCRDCLLVFPDNYNVYKENVIKVKTELKSKMDALYSHLLNGEHLRELLGRIIFNDDEVEYLVMKNNDEYSIYRVDEVINILLLSRLFQSSPSKRWSSGGLKIIMKSATKNKFSNIIEMEIRCSSSNHYCEFLFVSNRDKLFDTLNENIMNIKKIRNINLMGMADVLENIILET